MNQNNQIQVLLDSMLEEKEINIDIKIERHMPYEIVDEEIKIRGIVTAMFNNICSIDEKTKSWEVFYDDIIKTAP